MNRKLVAKLAFVALLGMVVIIFSHCGDKDATIKVATILGLTGENSAYAVKMQRGLEIAEEEINSRGGIKGKKLELLVEDSKWEPKLGVSAYRKLHDINGVRLFSAICGSTVALAICEVSKDDDIVIVDAISTAPKLTTHGGDKYFRVSPSDAVAGQNNVAWAIEEGAKSFVVVYVEDDWGASYKDAVVADIKSKGFNADVVPVLPGARDLRTEAQKVVDKKPDAVFLAIYANLAVPFIQQARSIGLTADLYGGDNLSSTELLVAGADAIEGVRISLPGGTKSAKWDAFAEAHRAKFNEDPDIFALKSYDALMLLGHAIENAGTEPKAIIKYLREMEPYEGASGEIQFDDNGDLVSQAYRRLIYVSGELKEWETK